MLGMKAFQLVALTCLIAIAPLHGQTEKDPNMQWLTRVAGDWTTTATHRYADGTQLIERGTISCRWILERTAVECDRRYQSGRFGHVVQHSAAVTTSTITLHAEIPLRGARVAIRSEWSWHEHQLSYRNETEEAPGRWRLDFDEQWRRN
jgi:hypothetical protein